jgi:hypothetical protein
MEVFLTALEMTGEEVERAHSLAQKPSGNHANAGTRAFKEIAGGQL